MNILITGHKGLIGTNLYNRLSKYNNVLGLDIKESEHQNLLNDHTEFLKEFKPEIVYHLAANGAESRGQISPVDMTQNNVGIFVSILRAAINSGVKKFIYTSSISVYGSAPTPYVEHGPTLPEDVYGANKLACEHILKIMSRVYDFQYVIVRPHNVYGPHQDMSDPYRNVVALFMRKLIEGQSYKLYGNGKMKRAFSYVDDVVDVLVDCMTQKFSGKTVNIGSSEKISIKELSDTLQELMKTSVPVEYVPARKQEISNFVADHTLQRSLVTYKNTPLSEGLKRTLDWVSSMELPPVLQKVNEIVI